MIVNGKLRDFVCTAAAKGQITFGDVCRLRRGYLPTGITNREELEMLISLNAKLVRADKTWGQWLVSAVADFVTAGEACERPFEDSKSVEPLLATHATKVGRRIARQIRCRLRGIQSKHSGTDVQSCDVQQAHQARVIDNSGDRSLRKKAEPARGEASKSPACSRPSRRRVRREMIPRTMTLASAAHGWCLAARRSDLINFQSSRVSLVLAPCL
jgi:hypothetical protein